jgi:hypothetical protein
MLVILNEDENYEAVPIYKPIKKTKWPYSKIMDIPGWPILKKMASGCIRKELCMMACHEGAFLIGLEL